MVQEIDQLCQTRSMESADLLGLSAAVMAAGSAMAHRIQDGVRARGFEDVRPAHGFTFALLSAAPATVGAIAAHLGVTKQAASQLVEELETKGYVARRRHPDDGRAWLVGLTARGRACTRAADAAALDAAREWESTLGELRLRRLCHDLVALGPAGPLRPAW